MTHSNTVRVLFVLLALGGRANFSPASASAVTIPTVLVGNAGNAPDPLTGNRFGAVGYNYRIGVTEVTNEQYAAFLNAKAASDPLDLYNTNMGSGIRGGILRSGSGMVSDPYVYTVKPNMADKPVTYVNWYDAIRFTNWLHNGQGSGDTETGAYTLLGGTPIPSNGTTVTRNSDAKWFLPSENEWYKAAYHQPAAQGGDSDDYWLFATASNTAPTVANANAFGDIINPGANVANYHLGTSWNGVTDGNLTTVGSAGPLSTSFYGTADQSGNAWEWNETLYDTEGWIERGMRGGAYGNDAEGIESSYFFYYDNPEHNAEWLGFRVATIPEPSTAALLAIGCLLTLWTHKRRK